MTIEKAIEILNKIMDPYYWHNPDKRAEAIKLGIEALKARQQQKADGYIDLDDLLPGETED